MNKELIDQVINDSSEIRDLNYDEILEIIGHDLILLKNLYNNNYNFSNDELISLAEFLNKIGNNRLFEILILMKNDDEKFFSKFIKNFKQMFSSKPDLKLNDSLVNEYNNIKLQDNLFYTYVYYNLVNPLKWLIEEKYEFNINKAISIAVNRCNFEVLEYLITIKRNKCLLIGYRFKISINKSYIDNYDLYAEKLNKKFEIIKFLNENDVIIKLYSPIIKELIDFYNLIENKKENDDMSEIRNYQMKLINYILKYGKVDYELNYSEYIKYNSDEITSWDVSNFKSMFKNTDSFNELDVNK